MLRERPFPLQPQRMYLPPNLIRPWRNLSIAVIPVAIVAIGFGLAARSSTPEPAPPMPEPVMTNIIQRSDKLYVEPAPAVVRTIPIVLAPPEPQSSPPPAPQPRQAATADEPPRRGVQKTRDICTRHGMRKVTTRGGRSWRCR